MTGPWKKGQVHTTSWVYIEGRLSQKGRKRARKVFLRDIEGVKRGNVKARRGGNRKKKG